MRIVGLLLVLANFLLSSCGVNYPYGNSAWYSDYLSEEDKAKLNQGEEVFINYNPADSSFLGLVRVLPKSNSENYKFIEIGNWKREFSYQNNGKLFPMQTFNKEEVVYDSLGNIVTQVIMEKYGKQPEYVQVAQVKLHNEIIEGKVYHLHHTIINHEDGSLKSESWQRIINYDSLVSHFLEEGFKFWLV